MQLVVLAGCGSCITLESSNIFSPKHHATWQKYVCVGMYMWLIKRGNSHCAWDCINVLLWTVDPLVLGLCVSLGLFSKPFSAKDTAVLLRESWPGGLRKDFQIWIKTMLCLWYCANTQICLKIFSDAMLLFGQIYEWSTERNYTMLSQQWKQ